MSDEATAAAPSTALAPVERVPVRMGLMPTSLEEGWRLAQHLAKSDLVPKGFKNKPEDVLVAMQMGAEIGFAPMQALQSIAVINGRPGVWGDGLLALVMAAPIYKDHDEYFEVKGERHDGLVPADWKADDTAAVCTFIRKGKATPVTRRFTVGQARKAGLLGKDGPWQTYPDRMLAMRARGFAARDAFADVLRGIRAAEELHDLPADAPVFAPKVVHRLSEQPAAAAAATATPEIETFRALHRAPRREQRAARLRGDFQSARQRVVRRGRRRRARTIRRDRSSAARHLRARGGWLAPRLLHGRGVTVSGLLTFDSTLHHYALDGVPIPRSVTGVLKTAGLIDFSGVPDGILERARLRGTRVHQAIHFFNDRDLDVAAFAEDFPECAPYLDAWITFCERRAFVPRLNEHRIVSRRYEVAGTLDCLGTLDGQAVLLDFATGDPADAAKDLQTAAYLLLAHEWASEDPALELFFAQHPVVRRFGVRLRADASFSLEGYADPSDARHFLTLVEAQRIVASRRRHPLAEVA